MQKELLEEALENDRSQIWNIDGYEQDCYGWNEEFMGCDSWRHDRGDVAKQALGNKI